jgi:hypothetical protein
MKWYAHPIEGTDQWCSESTQAEKDIKDLWPEDTQKPTPAELEQGIKAVAAMGTENPTLKEQASVSPGPTSGEEWLKEQMRALRWSEATLVGWIHRQPWATGLDCTGKAIEVVRRMVPEQRQAFEKALAEYVRLQKK